MTTPTQALIAITALNEMFEGSHFSICTIDKVARMLGVQPEREAYDQLHALHCVHWNKMPRELRSQMPGLIQQALSGEENFRFELVRPQDAGAMAILDASPHTRRPLLKRMFGAAR